MFHLRVPIHRVDIKRGACQKSNGAWRICTDFTDLSKACPKDSYTLPKIDKLVDAMIGHSLLTFIDVFSG